MTTINPLARNATAQRALKTAWKALRRIANDLPDNVVIAVGSPEQYGAMSDVTDEGSWVTYLPPTIFLAEERLELGGEIVIQTLLHGATHIIAHQCHFHDLSRQGRYHNGTFVNVASGLGLEYPEHQKPHYARGKSAVVLSAEALATYSGIIAYLDATLNVLPPAERSTHEQPSPSDSERPEPGRPRTRPPGAPDTSGFRAICDCEPPKVIRVSLKQIDRDGGIMCGACKKLFYVEDRGED